MDGPFKQKLKKKSLRVISNLKKIRQYSFILCPYQSIPTLFAASTELHTVTTVGAAKVIARKWAQNLLVQ